ncbi:FAD-dependent monooxygenase [Aquicoccus sp. G2-2]|uniref:FAD-dependent monooxygenase n=1 Tax=Aquicoccus sp. G2-2 TaxID=3092120 RepID=UPI002AE02E7D|nr:FAD-dependent monooxygenase [Aquicoccus sp. G2-2]MEA1112807.1 FAD-dependent monooxygenase [Aquicoccus sp. G2-2]
MDDLTGLNVIVIGAGIGGLAAACALGLRGARVRVLEQAPAITEVGAGLQMSPNAVAVLRGLGLEPALLASDAVRGRAVVLHDYRGGQVARLDLTRLKDQQYYFVHRADLISILERGARDAGAVIEPGARVATFKDGAAPVVELESGAQYHADLVIGADGLHSVVRPILNGPAVPFFTRQVAWRAVIPNTANRPAEAWVHMGPGAHLVSYPLRGGEWLNLVAVQERADWADEGWVHRDDPANLRAAFAGFGPAVQAMLRRVEEAHLWGLFRHEVASHWHGEGAVLLGDAAHPTLPFMAQGAAMALEDAWALASAVAAGADIPAGLARYQQHRFARASRVVRAANGNAWKYHLRSAPLRVVAHGVLRGAARFFPERMIHQFDWIYGYDVTAEG